MPRAAYYQVHLDDEALGLRSATVYAFGEGGQGSLVAYEQFGPFDTNLEIAQWMWRTVTRHLGDATV